MTEQERKRCDAFMMRKFGHLLGTKICESGISDDCVGTGPDCEFCVNSNMCTPCYNQKQKAYIISEQEKKKMNAQMEKKFGNPLGTKICKYGLSEDCVQMGVPFEFRLWTNMCTPCYNQKQKAYMRAKKAKKLKDAELMPMWMDEEIKKIDKAKKDAELMPMWMSDEINKAKQALKKATNKKSKIVK